MRKYISILMILLAFASIANAQSFGIFGTSSSNLVTDAVKPGLYLIKQEYVLRDTTNVNPQRYGFNNKDYFGCDYSLGIVLDRRMTTYGNILKPWEGDANYDNYRDNHTIRPDLSKRMFRNISDSTYLQARDTISFLGDSIFFSFAASNMPGFMSQYPSGKQEGWIVTLSGEKAQIDTLTNFTVNTYRNELDFENGLKNYEVKKLTLDDDLLGGFYIIPHYTQLGVIEFKVAGFLIWEEGKWYIRPLIDMNKEFENEQVPGALTPIIEPEQPTNVRKQRRR